MHAGVEVDILSHMPNLYSVKKPNLFILGLSFLQNIIRMWIGCVAELCEIATKLFGW